MSVFEQSEFLNVLFHVKIIVKCWWGSGDAVSSAVGPWRGPGWGSWGKGPEKCSVFLHLDGK